MKHLSKTPAPRNHPPWWVGLALVFTLGSLTPGPEARAYDFMVQATMVSQNYAVRDASDQALSRQRLDTYLRLFVMDLLPEKPTDRKKAYHTQINFSSAMRLRADFGDYTRSWDTSRRVHGLEGGASPAFELLYALLSITDIGGRVDLHLGRQFRLDPMDFYGFDGLQARFRLPFHLALEADVGLRTNGRSAIDAPIFLPNGTDVTDTNLGYLPMVSVAAEVHGLSFLTARVAYRSTWHVIDPNDPGAIFPEESVGQLARTAQSEEKLTAFVRASFWKQRIEVYGGLRYNLLAVRFDEVLGGVGVRITPRTALRLEYALDRPDYDGDSIFNLFNTEPAQELRLTYDQQLTARWSLYARATVRLFAGGDAEWPRGAESKAIEPDLGAGLGAAYVTSKLAARMDLYYQEGYGGRTVGAFGIVRGQIIPRWFALEGRAVVGYFDDTLNATPNGVSAGLGLAGIVSLGRRAALHVLVEDNFGTHDRSELRLLALLNLSWCSSGGCPAGEVVP